MIQPTGALAVCGSGHIHWKPSRAFRVYACLVGPTGKVVEHACTTIVGDHELSEVEASTRARRHLMENEWQTVQAGDRYATMVIFPVDADLKDIQKVVHG